MDAQNIAGAKGRRDECPDLLTIIVEAKIHTVCVLNHPTTSVNEDGTTYTGTLVDYDSSTWLLLDPYTSLATAPASYLASASELPSMTTTEESTAIIPSTPSSPSLATRTSSPVSPSTSATPDIQISTSTPTPTDTSTRTVAITIPTVVLAIILIGIASFFYKRHKRFAGSSYSPPAFQTTTPDHHRLEFDSQEILSGGAANAKGMGMSSNEASSTPTHTPQRQNSTFFARPVSYNHILNQQDHQQDHHHELQNTPTHSNPTGSILPVAEESEIGRAISPPGYEDEYHRHLTTSIVPPTHDNNNNRRVASQIIDQESSLLEHGRGQGEGLQNPPHQGSQQGGSVERHG